MKKYNVKNIRVKGVTLHEIPTFDIDKIVTKFFDRFPCDIDNLNYFDAGCAECAIFQKLFRLTTEEAETALDALDYLYGVENFMPCVKPFTSGKLYRELEMRAEELYTEALEVQQALEEDEYYRRIGGYPLF